MAGAEVNLLATARELARRGHAPGILHGPGTGKAESEWLQTFANHFQLDPRDPSESVKAAIRQFEPDALYVHKMADPSVLAALVASALPVVRMVHDHDLYCMRSYKYFPLTRKVCTYGAGLRCIFPCGAPLARSRNSGFPFKWVSYRAKKKELAFNRAFHRMIVASAYMREQLLANGFAPSQIEIHAPVPPTAEAVAPSSFSDRNLIVYAGQVIRGKGVDILLEALSLVRTPFECVILGDGNHRAHCEALNRRLGLEERVHFTGYVPPADMRGYYSGASLAVVSSVWPEPFGAVGLEAMRHGLPTVAFDVGGIREWLEDGRTGFLVPWMDRKQFAMRIDQLLSDKPLARRLGENGRQIAAGRFAFARYIAGLESLFERVVGDSKLAVSR